LIDANRLKYVLEYTSKVILDLESELNTLDSAIGDGDHGTNMSRGFCKVLENIDNVEFDSVAKTCSTIGDMLMSSIGGASGALYGLFFIHVGGSLPDQDSPITSEVFVRALEDGVQAIKELGESDVNQKTMLDVIIPVIERLKKEKFSLQDICRFAKLQSQSTIMMKARKGRASFLGDRSIGHLDPGARSSEAIITSICKALAN